MDPRTRLTIKVSGIWGVAILVIIAANLYVSFRQNAQPEPFEFEASNGVRIIDDN